MDQRERAAALVKKVFASDKRIQFCAVVSSQGLVMEGGMRPGLRSLEPAEETKRIVQRLFLSQTMNQAADSYLGPASWAIVRRQKLLHITLPLSDGRQLQVTASVGYPAANVDRLDELVRQVYPGK